MSLAASDFASSVVTYNPGSLTTYTNAAAALGRPAVDTDFEGVQVPVVPPYQAWQDSALVSIPSDGELVLAFDHRVLDDPDNPYGIDFIVFGNAFQIIDGATPWDYGDPETTTMGAGIRREQGTVEVSADGSNWVTFTEGPYADQFAPTLGRRYDPENAVDYAVFPNAHWGPHTDPSIPVDPSVSATNLSGFTLAEYCRRYRGSAGGTGFDLAELNLPLDEQSGHKYFSYIQITSAVSEPVEIDAVADAAPADAYTLWRIEHFNWLGDPALEAPAADPDQDALPNWAEFILAMDPRETNSPPVIELQLGTPSGLVLSYSMSTNAEPGAVLVERSVAGGSWSTNGVTATQYDALGDGTFKTSVTLSNQFPTAQFRLHIPIPSP